MQNNSQNGLEATESDERNLASIKIKKWRKLMRVIETYNKIDLTRPFDESEEVLKLVTFFVTLPVE